MAWSLAGLFGSYLLLASCLLHAQQLTQYVDSLVGTGGHGRVFPGANVPFGAV